MKISAAIWLDQADSAPLQKQLVQQLRSLIENGSLSDGEMVPSTRDLAEQLKVSRNTVVYAYDQLIGQGFLASKPRAGIFVIPSLESAFRTRRPNRAMGVERDRALPKPTGEPSTLCLPKPFRPCQPDVSLFPLMLWNRFRGQALRTEGNRLLHYQESCRMGLPALRKALADYLHANRGVKCDYRQIAITSGSQQALFVLSGLLLGPGKQVYMESPGYQGAQMAWRDAGAAIDPGGLDSEGLLVPPEGPRYTLLYTTPSRQFPTGVSMSLARRRALLDYAERNGSWIVEDDYDSEFRYSAPPMPSLQSLDVAGKVIYLGTFSKLLFPSLRIGYIVLPAELVNEFERRRALLDEHGPLIDQATLLRFVDSGAFHTHIKRCRRTYAERQAVFLEHVEHMGLPFHLPFRDGGMNLGAFLPEHCDDVCWSKTCRDAGFDVPAMSAYALGPVMPGLVFGFTAFPPDLIRASLDRMSALLHRAHLF